MDDLSPVRDEPAPRHVERHDDIDGLLATLALAPIGLAQFAIDGRMLFVNERLCEILGCDRQTALGRTFHELTFPQDLPRCVELTERLAAREIPSYVLQKRFVRPDGSAVWTRVTVSAVRRADGETAFFIGAAEDIGDEVEASEAVKTAEERLRVALEASRIGTFKYDLRLARLEWADGLERVFGTGEHATLEDFMEVIHPDDRPYVTAAIAESMEKGADLEEEFRATWADGSTHWLHDRGRVVPDEDGRPRYIVGAITDVTNHKRMEEVIREGEAQFQELANSISQMAWIAAPDGTRPWFNDRWYVYTGSDPEEMKGLGWMDVHEPGLGERVLEQQLEAFRSGVAWEETVRLRGKDGSYRWFLSRAVPVHAADGSIERWFGTNTDITERLESEHRLRRALDVENIGVIFFDNDHKITGINRAFSAMSGYTEDEVAGGMVLWRDLAPVSGRDFARSRELAYDGDGRTTPTEQEFVRPDGTHWWGLASATRISATEGVKFVLDVTARKEATRQREELLLREREARSEAERAIELRQQVLGFVAHDLRNPLQTVLASSSLLLDLPLPEAKRREQLELIKRSAWAMDRLIGDLLDLSRIEAGTFAVHHDRVDVKEVAAEVVAAFRERVRAQGIAFDADVAPECPLVSGDHQRLVQALSNLVGNAVKFTASGGRVVLATRHDPPHVECSVQDTGRGIPESELPAIFDQFWQANRTGGGAGLGLAIVKGIVEAHGGSVSVESVVGRGSTFRLRLPMANG